MSHLITGGTGFIGSHIARALVARGDDVRCLARPGSCRDNLEGLPVQLVDGDLTDRASIARAMRGVDTVYHCGADYRLWSPAPEELYATNVEGTRNVLEEAHRAGVRRIVHTSSVGTLGAGSAQPAEESRPVEESDMVGHYKRSKFRAERLAESLAASGVPVVIVNPSTPVGDLDRKPTPTGQIVLDFLTGRMPAYVETGLNVVDVRDVAIGHLLAAQHGRPGRKYILGGHNLTLQELLQRLAHICGQPAPRMRLPRWMPMVFAAATAPWARLTRSPPRVSMEAARMARTTMFFDSGRAIRELGYHPAAVEPALRRAVLWFCRNGYVDGEQAIELARRAASSA